MTDCVIHSKVYSNNVLLSDPPKRQWICSVCGHRDIETIGFQTFGETYSDLVRKFSFESNGYDSAE